MGTEFFIMVGVLPVELLAYQVSMVCVAIWPFYILDQEPITRSMQLPHIPATAFSPTDLFLV